MFIEKYEAKAKPAGTFTAWDPDKEKKRQEELWGGISYTTPLYFLEGDWTITFSEEITNEPGRN